MVKAKHLRENKREVLEDYSDYSGWRIIPGSWVNTIGPFY